MKILSHKRIEVDLQDAIDQIYKREGEKLCKEQFLHLYSSVYDYCTIDESAVISDHQIHHDAVKTLYKLAADNIGHCAKDIVEHCNDLTDEDSLKFYTQQWEYFKFSSKVVNAVFHYVNRTFIRCRILEKYYEIYQVAMFKWRDIVFASLSNKISKAILTLIDKGRKGEIIDAQLIRGVTSSYVDIGSDSENPVNVLEMYDDAFQKAFIEDTKKYYSTESNEFLSQHSVSAYIKKIESIFQEEKKRVCLYLQNSALDLFIHNCKQQVLLSNHIDAILEEFKKLLPDGNTEDLSRLFQFISKIPCEFTKLRSIFESHIHQEGLTAIEKYGTDSLNDAALYVKSISRVYQRYNKLISEVFSNNRDLLKALDIACSKFTNNNFITNTENLSSVRSAELIANYCDIVLQKRAKNIDDDLEDTLDQIILVFKFLDDKDVFQKLYTKDLAIRLVQHTSISDDAEASMISKLKLECGFEYTYNLHRMITDITSSKDVSDKFSELYGPSFSNGRDFNTHVISSGIWPLQYNDTYSFSLPAELENVVLNFDDFYNCQHTGRKLRWIYQLSRGELITNCFKDKYTLKISGSQMAVLLQYNECDEFTMKELEECTMMNWKYLVQVLQMLIKTKILKCNDDLKPTSVVALNMQYKSKKRRLNLKVPMKIDNKTREQQTENLITNQRNFLIQASIVRIMKSRKTLNHQQLVAEVIGQLSSQFKPNPSSIKKSISILLEKEYIERADEESIYNYVA